jgi:deazaflavin-dependent oxidoreductase (nitroreductase family)
MKKLLFVVAAAVTWTGWFVRWWRQHPRAGAATVNRVINPWLMRQGVADVSRGEIGLMEHIGRISGTVRVTPIHPVVTDNGLRIIVPLGGESQWARNVIAAGHCRVQVGETIRELDEPKLVSPTEVEAVPPVAARVMDWLGFRYLLLHQFAEAPGTLDVPLVEAAQTVESIQQAAEEVPVVEPELVATS